MFPVFSTTQTQAPDDRHSTITTPHTTDTSLTTGVHRRAEPGALDIHPTSDYTLLAFVA